MAGHRRHRHAPLRARSRDGARAEGVRRLIKTPTFALGLGVLIAAVLAFGTTQTYLRFNGSGPGGCGATGCADPAARPTPGTAKAGHAHGPAVQITYTTLGTSATGFTAQLAISNRSGHPLNGWHLAIAYNGSKITGLTGAQWQPRPGSASATIRPAATSGPLGAGKTVRITYTATGNAGLPTDCTFDAVPCHIWSTAS